MAYIIYKNKMDSTNFSKLNKSQLKQLVKQFKNDLEKQISFIKTHKLSKMKKAELVSLVEVLFSDDGQDKEEKRAPEVVDEEV